MSILSAMFCYSLAFSASELLRVGQWDRFESSVTNSNPYADPCTDVTLDVTYTRPDGSEVSFWGFYDGGTTWRIRFMPDQLGTWSYHAEFSDGSPGVRGSFECVPSTIPGMLTADETNPIWFGFKGGKHTLIRSFHVGDRFFAENWQESSRAAFLDWLQAQGYNMLSIASHYLNRDTPERGRGWNTPDLWPLNAVEYQKMEAILDDLARRRILVFPFAGFFGRDSDFPNDPEQQTQFIRYTLARLGPYWNILLSVAGPEPNLKKSYLSSSDVIRPGRTIRELDVFAHPVSVHNRTGDDPYRDSDWTTYGVLQGPKTTDRGKLSSGLLENHHSAKPLYAQETLWPGNKNHPYYSDDDIRKNAYVINMSAAALNFADMDGDSSSGFSGSMDLEEKIQSRHTIVKQVWGFFETIPFHRMAPRQELVDQGYCLAEEGREYLVYLESPGSVSIQVEDGPFNVEWINARNTADRRLAGTTEDGKNLISPEDGGDWLLHLFRAIDDATGKRKRTFSVFSVNSSNTGTELSGRPFLVVGLRTSNALISDERIQELIDNMDVFASYGINTFSVYFQGSRFGDIKGYDEDGTLNTAYAVRMGRIIEAADARGMVILVGCLYYGNSRGKWDSWGQAEANRAIANTVRWLKDSNYRNVFIDVNNEHMAKLDDSQLIAAGKAVDPSYVIGTTGRETPANADLSLHHGSPNIPDKYYIESEGTGGDYWGDYSKREGLYNYINIGIYPDEMKRRMIDYTNRFLKKGQGFMFASTWLQCPSPSGPNHTPGGIGTSDDPGILWWLKHVRSLVGPYEYAGVGSVDSDIGR